MLLAFMIMSCSGSNIWSPGSMLEVQMSLIAEEMLAEVRCDILVYAPTAKAKCGIRNELIELVTVVVLLLFVCCLTAPFNLQPHRSFTTPKSPPQLYCKTAPKYCRVVSRRQIYKRSTTSMVDNLEYASDDEREGFYDVSQHASCQLSLVLTMNRAPPLASALRTSNLSPV